MVLKADFLLEVSNTVLNANLLTFYYFLCPGKAPLPRPDYKSPEPNGCSSYFLGLKVPESVCTPNLLQFSSTNITLTDHPRRKKCIMLFKMHPILYT